MARTPTVLISGALHAGTVELVDARAGLTCPVLGAKATQEPLHGLNEPPLSAKECDQSLAGIENEVTESARSSVVVRTLLDSYSESQEDYKVLDTGHTPPGGGPVLCE